MALGPKLYALGGRARLSWPLRVNRSDADAVQLFGSAGAAGGDNPRCGGVAADVASWRMGSAYIEPAALLEQLAASSSEAPRGQGSGPRESVRESGVPGLNV